MLQFILPICILFPCRKQNSPHLESRQIYAGFAKTDVRRANRPHIRKGGHFVRKYHATFKYSETADGSFGAPSIKEDCRPFFRCQMHKLSGYWV